MNKNWLLGACLLLGATLSVGLILLLRGEEPGVRCILLQEPEAPSIVELLPPPKIVPDVQNPSEKSREPELLPNPQVLAEPKSADPVELLGETRKIDAPNGEYTLEPLDNQDSVKLVGKVKTLKIGLVHGQAVLDASRLEVKEVILMGTIDGRGKVKLNAPNGSLEFRAKVDGDEILEINAPGGKLDFRAKFDGNSRLVIHAPGGTVTFSQSTNNVGEGSKIAGGAKATITAQKVEFRGAVKGGAEVTIVLTPTGSLIVHEMEEGGRILYRKAAPKDPEPVVTPGTMKGGAQLKKID